MTRVWYCTFFVELKKWRPPWGGPAPAAGKGNEKTSAVRRLSRRLPNHFSVPAPAGHSAFRHE
jgi:hypothetical protein